jgi:hypothetical protein
MSPLMSRTCSCFGAAAGLLSFALLLYSVSGVGV